MYLGTGGRDRKDKVDVNVGGIWVETVEEFIDVSLKLCQNKKYRKKEHLLLLLLKLNAFPGESTCHSAVLVGGGILSSLSKILLYQVA